MTPGLRTYTSSQQLSDLVFLVHFSDEMSTRCPIGHQYGITGPTELTIEFDPG